MSIEDIAFKLESVTSTRTAAVIGIIIALGGPLLIISYGGRQAHNLPWFVWVILSLVLLVAFGLGYLLFRVNHDSRDISISPNPRADRIDLSQDVA